MPEPRTINAAEALREAMDLALERWPDVFLMGEGVADPKGIFGTTVGLADKHGSERVVEMPVSENGLTGVAIGAALMGRRPVLVHQRVDFALLSIEQLFNSAAKSHYVTGGRHRVPLVVRMVIGRGWGQGPQHSQSLEAMFAHVPGLKVVMPSTPREFKGLLLGAIEDDNPVLMLEHRWLHYVTGDVPEGFYSIPLDGPRLAREGQDVTIVASSYMALEALGAAEALAGVGCAAEVFDLRMLRPLALDPILASVQKTGRLITVDTGWRIGGMGAEIVAEITERAFAHLKAPPRRIGLPDHPTPSSRALAAAYYPGSVDIVDAVEQLLELDQGAAEGARQACVAARQGVPIDKPDPAFKGPF
jgi:pyruvate dehydrogenase E1 component beta subunit